MGQTIDDSALDTLFREARTYTTWQHVQRRDELTLILESGRRLVQGHA